MFYGGPLGPDIRKGVTITLGGPPVLIHGDPGSLFEDERAHTYMTMCKGASGIKPCVLCRNVVRVQSNLLPDPT
eukprot:8317272-Pyramimonas_sp.AAC.1